VLMVRAVRGPVVVFSGMSAHCGACECRTVDDYGAVRDNICVQCAWTCKQPCVYKRAPCGS